MEILKTDELNKKDKEGTEEKTVALPSEGLREGEDNLITESIVPAISGSVVKTIIIPENEVVELPNIVLDFSKSKNANIFQRNAIKSLVSESGDLAVYLYTKGRLMKLGYGDSQKVYRILGDFNTYVLDDDTHIYENVERGKELKEVKKLDPTKLRLKI